MNLYPLNRHIKCLQWAIPSGMRIIFQSISTAWVVFPVLYKSVFFPDYLLLINLFFLRGRCVSTAAMFVTHCNLPVCGCSVAFGGKIKGVSKERGCDGVSSYYKREPSHVTLSQPAGVYMGSMAVRAVWLITTIFSLVHLTPLISLEGK